MYCKNCGHPLIHTTEKAIDEPRTEAWQPVWTSTLTEEWICRSDGNEHEPGSLDDWARRVQTSMAGVKAMYDDGDLTAEQALTAILVDAGVVQRSEESARIGQLIRDGDIEGLRDPAVVAAANLSQAALVDAATEAVALGDVDLPAGYRWAREDEMDREDAIVVPRTADSTGRPYTQGEADLAVPVSEKT